MAHAISASHPDLLAPRFNGRELALWASAALIIVSAHAGSVWALNQLRPEEQAASEAAPVAVMIDLAPQVVMPNAVPDQMVDLVESIDTPTLDEPTEEVEPTETPPLEPVLETVEQQPVDPVEPLPPQPVEMTSVEPVPVEPLTEIVETPEAQPLEMASLEPTPVEPAPLEPAPVEPQALETVQPVEPLVQEIVTETLPEVLPEVVLAVPVTRPDVIEPVPEPEPKPQARPVRKPPPPKAQRKPAPQPSVARQVAAREAPVAAAPRPTDGGVTNGESPARWQSRVNSHLNRFKRYPGGETAQGTASVRFTINASGRVLSVALARSSGSGALDQAALDMVRRASPVPAPPPAIARGSMGLTVPVNFSRR